MGREQFFTEPTGCEKIEGICSHRVLFFCENNSITYFHHSHFRYIFNWKSTPSRRSSRGHPEPPGGHGGSLQARNPNAHPDPPIQNKTAQGTETPRHLRTSPPPPQTYGNESNYNRNPLETHTISKRKIPMDQNHWNEYAFQ